MTKKSMLCMYLITMGLFVIMSTFFLCSLQASELTGKVFRCYNKDLKGDNSNDSTFALKGRFMSDIMVNATIDLNIPGRTACDLSAKAITATQNQTTGKWEGENVSFSISRDGFIENFYYSKSSAFGTCKITLTRLKLSGSALPYLFLLLN